MSLRLLIVDDNEQFLEAARRLLEADGMRVVGVATTVAASPGLNLERAPGIGHGSTLM